MRARAETGAGRSVRSPFPPFTAGIIDRLPALAGELFQARSSRVALASDPPCRLTPLVIPPWNDAGILQVESFEGRSLRQFRGELAADRKIDRPTCTTCSLSPLVSPLRAPPRQSTLGSLSSASESVAKLGGIELAQDASNGKPRPESRTTVGLGEFLVSIASSLCVKLFRIQQPWHWNFAALEFWTY